MYVALAVPLLAVVDLVNLVYLESMKLLALYHLEGENSTITDEYLRQVSQRTSMDIEKVNIESPQGSALAETYDMVEYPALLIIQDDGQVLKFWQGINFPLVDELVGYLNS